MSQRSWIRVLLPKMRKDVNYLKRHHFEIVRGPGDDAIVQESTAAVIAALAAGQLRLRVQSRMHPGQRPCRIGFVRVQV